MRSLCRDVARGRRRAFAAVLLFAFARLIYQQHEETAISRFESLQAETISKTTDVRNDETNETYEASCSCDPSLQLQMAAIPHTASSTTDGFFSKASVAWNTSLTLVERGFVCDKGRTGVEKATAQQCVGIIPCIFESLKYRHKQHNNYETLRSSGNGIVFTTLRDPGQVVLSQYGMRTVWDRLWDVVHHDMSLSNVEVVDWVERAWWRHNLGTKILSTNTRVIWASQHQSPDIVPTKEENDHENSLGERSGWLHTAIQHLHSMPAFALMHRLEESFELYSFTFCVSGHVKWREGKKPREVSDELQALVERYFKLDLLLLEEAEKIFEERIAHMRQLKQKDWLCDLGPLLNQPEHVSVGVFCEQ